MGKLNDDIRQFIPDIKECVLLLMDEYKEFFKNSLFVWAKPWVFKDSRNIEFQEGNDWIPYLRGDVYSCKEPKDTALCGMLEPVCEVVPAPSFREIADSLVIEKSEITMDRRNPDYVAMTWHIIGDSKIFHSSGDTPEDAIIRLWFLVNRCVKNG